MRKLFLVLFLALLARNANAADRYVCTTGDDANSGTLISPYKTIAKALSVRLSGERIGLCAGTYDFGNLDNVPFFSSDGGAVFFNIPSGTIPLGPSLEFWQRIPAPAPPSGDTVAPTIRFYTTDLATFTGNDRMVSVGVSDNVGVVRVEMYRNGLSTPIVVAAEGKLSATTYLRWQANYIPKATYILTVYAYDAAGNKSAPASIRIIKK